MSKRYAWSLLTVPAYKLTALTTGGNLHFYNISGCAGVFNNGDPATLRATFAVSPRQKITSP